MPKYPSVLVGCPTNEIKGYCLDKYVEGLYSLSYSNFDVCVEDNSKSSEYYKRLTSIADEWDKRHEKSTFRVIRSGYNSPKARTRLVEGRNKLVDLVLREKYDYFFSLEQDIVPPPDVIERLMSHSKDIVSGVYFVGKRDEKGVRLEAVAYKKKVKIGDVEGFPVFSFDELMPSRLVGNLAFTGVGCLLIKKEVLKKIRFRYDLNIEACDDRFFGEDARKNGFEIFLDTSMFCSHMPNSWAAEAKATNTF